MPLPRKITYPFFSRVAELRSLSSSDFDTSVSSTTTESFLVLSESCDGVKENDSEFNDTDRELRKSSETTLGEKIRNEQCDTTNDDTSIQVKNTRSQPEKLKRSSGKQKLKVSRETNNSQTSGGKESTISEISTHTKEQDYRGNGADSIVNHLVLEKVKNSAKQEARSSCITADPVSRKGSHIQMGQPEKLRRSAGKEKLNVSNETRNKRNISQTSGERKNTRTKCRTRTETQHYRGKSVNSVGNHLVLGKAKTLVKDEAHPSCNAADPTDENEFVLKRKARAMNNSLEQIYERYLQRNPKNYIPLITQSSSFSSKMPQKKNKYTLGKNRIKCIRNNVKKDILGDQYKFLQTPIDSELSTITSVELMKERIVPEHLQVVQHKNGGQAMLSSSTRKPPTQLANPQSRHKAPQIQLPSIIEITEKSNSVKSKISEKKTSGPRDVQSESSIKTMIMKRHTDHFNIPSLAVVQYSYKNKDGFPWNHSDQKQLDCRMNVGDINTELRKSREAEMNINCTHSTNIDNSAKTIHPLECRKNESNKMIEFVDSITNIKCEKKVGINKTSSEKMEEFRPRVVLNTLYVKNRYLVLHCQSETDPKERGIILGPPVGLRKPKSCPPDQGFPTTFGTLRKRSLVMNKINELMVPVQISKGEMESKDMRGDIKYLEQKETPFSPKLVKSIMWHQDADGKYCRPDEAREDIFKSNCDVYYINKVRNFKRKKCLTEMDKEAKSNPGDEVFNRKTCHTVYVNKARNFEKNISKLNLLK